MFDKLQPKQVVWWVDKNNTPQPLKVLEDWTIVTKPIWWNSVDFDFTSDAWGRMKSVEDFSVFDWKWNYDVNWNIWKGKEDWNEVSDLSSSTRIVSTNWNLEIKTTASNWTDTDIISFRSPRYQANRWHLYSTSLFLPNAETTWATCRWGLGVFDAWNIETWVYFEITDWVLYAVVKSEWTERFKENITQAMTDATWRTIASLVNWTLFDIQFQWRGAWDYFFYIDWKLVYTHNFLWNTTEVTMSNPQLPCFFEAKNVSAWEIISLKSWCVNISSEWGERGALTDASFSNSWLATVDWSAWLPRKPLAIFKVEETFKWKINTRNLRLLRVTSSAYTRACKVGFAITRDSSAITLWTWVFTPVNSYSSLSVIDMTDWSPTTSVDFAKTNISYKATIPAENTWEANEPNPDLDFFLSAWDYVIVFARQVKTWTDAEADCTVEFWEEV